MKTYNIRITESESCLEFNVKAENLSDAQAKVEFFMLKVNKLLISGLFPNLKITNLDCSF